MNRILITLLALVPCIADAQVNAWSLGWRDKDCTTAVNFDEKPQAGGRCENWARKEDTAVLYASPVVAAQGRANVMNATAGNAGRVTDLYTRSGLDKTKPFTISMWVYTTLTGAIDTVWTVGNTGAGAYSGQSFQDASYHVVYNGSQGVNQITDAKCAKLPTSQWVHYVVTYDGAYTDVTSWKVYYNKTSQSMSSYTPNDTGLTPTSNTRWSLIHSSGNYVVGYIDNVQFFNRTLTQSEVNQLYEEGLVNK